MRYLLYSLFLLPQILVAFPTAMRFSGDDVALIAEASRAAYNPKKDFMKTFKKGGWRLTNFAGVAGLAQTHRAGFVASKGKRIIIAFHGTEGLFDAITDIKTTKTSAQSLGIAGQVHKGFLDAFTSSWEQLRAIILRHIGEAALQPKDIEYVITGHSMGAALATLCAAKLLADQELTGKNNKNNKVKTVPIASPRVWDQKAAAAYEKLVGQDNSLRIWYYGDPVTAMPLGSMGFKHVGKSIRVSVPQEFFATLSSTIAKVSKGKMDKKELMKKTVGLHFLEGYLEKIKETFEDYKRNPVQHPGVLAQMREAGFDNAADKIEGLGANMYAKILSVSARVQKHTALKKFQGKFCPYFKLNNLTLSKIKNNLTKGILSIGCLAPIFFDFAYLICGDELKNYACGKIASGSSPQLAKIRVMARVLKKTVPDFKLGEYIEKAKPIFDFDKKCWRKKKKPTCIMTAAEHVVIKGVTPANANSTIAWGFEKFCKAMINYGDLIATDPAGNTHISDKNAHSITTTCTNWCRSRSDKCNLAVVEEPEITEDDL